MTFFEGIAKMCIARIELDQKSPNVQLGVCLTTIRRYWSNMRVNEYACDLYPSWKQNRLGLPDVTVSIILKCGDGIDQVL